MNLLDQKAYERWYDLIPHPVQLALVRERKRFPVVPAGRRCLKKGTLVATSSGPVPIENLRPGSVVLGYDANGGVSDTLVTHVWYNGVQKVTSLVSSYREYVSATKNHKLFACDEMFYDKRRTHLADRYKYKKRKIEDIGRRQRVKRVYLGDLITGGEKHIERAYSLGALTGDGCSRDNKSTTYQYQSTISISSSDDLVPSIVAKEIGGELIYPRNDNYTYKIVYGLGIADRVPFYKEWLSGRYAHEKIAIWDEVDTWDRESALAYLAGVIDTDGSIYYKTPNNTEAVVCISMQAKSVVEVCQNIIFKYFQEIPTLHRDRREKYKNGDVWNIKTTSNVQAFNIIESLRGTSLKASKFDTSTLKFRNVKFDRIGLQHGGCECAHTYDITVGNDTNMYILHHGGIVTSNSGKTERFKRYVLKECMTNPGNMYFIGAPTRDQVKRIYWKDVKLMSFSHQFPRRPSESDLIITFPNLTELHLIGLDEPARIEGVPWDGGGIDEIANIKEHAWSENILPALDTERPDRPGQSAWCWLLGVPDGLNHYYDMSEYARTSGDPEWGHYHWKSSEILSPEKIEARKRTMSARQFRQEYEASFETVSGRIYDDYGPENETRETIQPHEQLLWAHDQNFTPLSSAVSVQRGDYVLILDEIVLESAVSRQSAVEFVEKFRDHKNKNVTIYGDPAGRAGEKHGHASDYTEIEKVLRLNGWKFNRRVRPGHPSIKDRQNTVRTRIKNALGEVRLLVNPNTAPWSHKGLATVTTKKGSTFQEDDTNEYSHITTAIGYMLDYMYNGPKTTVQRLGL